MPSVCVLRHERYARKFRLAKLDRKNQKQLAAPAAMQQNTFLLHRRLSASFLTIFVSRLSLRTSVRRTPRAVCARIYRRHKYFWPSPPQYHNRHRYTILRQINDIEASNRMVCTQAEVQWQSSVIWFDSSAKLSHVVISGGHILLCWEVKNTNMTIVWVHARPFTTSVPYSHQHMI